MPNVHHQDTSKWMTPPLKLATPQFHPLKYKFHLAIKEMLLNLDRQLPVQHVKLEVGVEVVGQPLPLRLLETRKPSCTNVISCFQLIELEATCAAPHLLGRL